MTERLLHAREIAELLGVRPSTVYSLCRRRLLVHIRISEGRRRPLIRFRRQDVEAFIESKLTTAQPAPEKK